MVVYRVALLASRRLPRGHTGRRNSWVRPPFAASASGRQGPLVRPPAERALTVFGQPAASGGSLPDSSDFGPVSFGWLQAVAVLLRAATFPCRHLPGLASLRLKPLRVSGPIAGETLERAGHPVFCRGDGGSSSTNSAA